jgi:Tfp pilus assembly protein PilN
MIGSLKKQQFPIGLPVVNLLSPSVFEAMAARTMRRLFVAASLVLALAVAGGWGVQHLRSVQAQKMLTVEQAETARLTADSKELAPVAAYVAEVANQKTVVKKAMANEALMSRVLDDLRSATPTGVRIETANAVINGAQPAGQAAQATANVCPAPNPFVRQTSVGCITLTGTATSRAVVGQFVIKLGAGGVFVAPYVTTTSTADGKQVTFSGSVSVSKKVYSNRYADIDALLAATGGR